MGRLGESSFDDKEVEDITNSYLVGDTSSKPSSDNSID